MTREEWDARYSGSDLVWTARPNRFLVAEVAAMTPGRALDLACGEGRNAVWLAAQGWEVTAVDFSATAIDKARRLGADSAVEIDWHVADVTRWEPSPAAFGLVVVFYLHVPPADLRAVLHNASGALAAGGTLLIVGHALRNLTAGSGGPQDPSLLYGPDDIARHLTGLTVERAEEVERILDAGGVALDVLVRARRD